MRHLVAALHHLSCAFSTISTLVFIFLLNFLIQLPFLALIAVEEIGPRQATTQL